MLEVVAETLVGNVSRFAAGVQTMMRTAKEFQTTGRPGGADRDKKSDGGAGRTGNTD